MEPQKRYKIPTLDEMANSDRGENAEPLFKRQKESENQSSAMILKHIDSATNVNITKTVTNQNATRSTDSNGSNILSRLPLPSAVSTVQDTDRLQNNPNKKNSDNLSIDLRTDNLKSVSSNGMDETTKGPPITSKPGTSNSLIVNTRQRGNPVLKSIRNIPWEYGNIVPDYVMGQTNCALFLSLRYHQLHPNYIHERLGLLGKSYDLRVMLVHVDVKEPHHMLKDLAKICLLADCTLILAFSPEEAGRYLETYKIFENKPPEAIMERTEENFMAKFTDCLTRVKSVNRTDCATLISHFGSLTNIIEASEEDLSLCPGFGPQKAKRLHNIFHEPFLRSGTVHKH
uniref:DNA excision repair protein ERCC-1 n=1 Tax=Arion vulgaris TaxID=1028688 RepID=A0A0B6Z2T9_9EUPU